MPRGLQFYKGMTSLKQLLWRKHIPLCLDHHKKEEAENAPLKMTLLANPGR